MTLAIFVSPNLDDPTEPPVGRWNAGFEEYRSRLWGRLNELNLELRLLPQVSHDLTVFPSQFGELLDECARLEQRVASQSVGRWALDEDLRDHLLEYLSNIREAVELARRTGPRAYIEVS